LYLVIWRFGDFSAQRHPLRGQPATVRGTSLTQVVEDGSAGRGHDRKEFQSLAPQFGGPFRVAQSQPPVGASTVPTRIMDCARSVIPSIGKTPNQFNIGTGIIPTLGRLNQQSPDRQITVKSPNHQIQYSPSPSSPARNPRSVHQSPQLLDRLWVVVDLQAQHNVVVQPDAGVLLDDEERGGLLTAMISASGLAGFERCDQPE